MKPSELLELCMELNAQGLRCGMDAVGTVDSFYFTVRVHGSGMAIYFEHPDNLGSCYFSENQIQDAADWLRKQHEEFRSKQ